MIASGSTADWEVGSDFDAASAWSVAGDRQCGVDLSTVSLVASGRQALVAVAGRARELGCDTVVFPEHFCESMAQPFQSRKLRVHFAPVTDDWRLAPPAVSPEPGRTLVYSMPYFGVPESDSWVRYVTEMQEAGALVLTDETHRVHGRPRVAADWALASLRKMLPVPDGAYVVGEVGPVAQQIGDQGRARWQAMERKSAQLAAGGRRDYLDFFHTSEGLTETELTPAPVSDVTRGLLKTLDHERMREARVANSRALGEALAGSRVRVTTAAAPVPSHHVLAGPHACDLRAFLIQNCVYAPVHWPRPKGWDGSWREDILSIPVDHRYTPQDMHRVADLIHEYERGER